MVSSEQGGRAVGGEFREEMKRERRQMWGSEAIQVIVKALGFYLSEMGNYRVNLSREVE